MINSCSRQGSSELKPRLAALFSNKATSKSEMQKLKKSLALPKTKFPMRANAWERENNFVERCTTKLYQWQQSVRKGEEFKSFTLHDGPPFANGSLHMGHFMNKTLKDIINRYHLLKGQRVNYIPGWDCHGLPIELKALEKEKNDSSKTANDSASPGDGFKNALNVRKKARKLAEKTIKQHVRDFKRWGIMADWKPEKENGHYPSRGFYATMDKEYEAKQLDVFEKMVNNGLVYRGLKPVYWSPSSHTALAEAELEYVDDHTSTASYVSFPLNVKQVQEVCRGLSPESACSMEDIKDIHAVIWTTTPWTLLSNVAISVNKNFKYSVVQSVNDKSKAYIVAFDLLDDFASKLNLSKDQLSILNNLQGSELSGLSYKHPLCDNFQPFENEKTDSSIYHTIMCGDHVTTDSGTGLVHTAPAHGHDDAKVWKDNGGNIENCPSPINSSGEYSLLSETECLPVASKDVWAAVEGKAVVSKCVSEESVDDIILRLLEDRGFLLSAEKYSHRYPYDWRTKQPVIVRATKQWFVNLTKLKDDAREALRVVDLVPASSRPRLESMVEGRDEWCISRQRSWGVPIPAFYKSEKTGSDAANNDDEILMNRESLQYVRDNVAKYGTDWWWFVSDEELEKHIGKGWRRGMDTLDVWFDSGSSWNSVLGNKGADIYLEGSDQHRGWFQSSLLTNLGYDLSDNLNDTSSPSAPYKKLVTHGFVLDENMRKMSKSLGNIIEPNQLINGENIGKLKQVPKFGSDVIRMWAASTDFTKDATIGVGIVSSASDSLRKIRNTARFLLGNLNDFRPDENVSLLDEPFKLDPIDQYMLDRMANFMESVDKGYAECNFRTVYSEILRFTSTEVSAIYSDSVKDRLYADKADSFSRRSCQAVLWHLLQAITISLAPIACFTAEDIFEYTSNEVKPFPSHTDLAVEGLFSVFQCGWYEPKTAWKNPGLVSIFNHLLEIRSEVNKALDTLRTEGMVRSSQEIHIRVISDDKEELLLDGVKLSAYIQENSSSIANLLQVAGCSVLRTDEVDNECVLATVEYSNKKLKLELVRSEHDKCERCWKYTAPQGSHICNRRPIMQIFRSKVKWSRSNTPIVKIQEGFTCQMV